MIKQILSTTALLSLLAALPAGATQLTLDQISAYLNDLKTAQGKFTQINDDSSISTGVVSIQRPGRIRFDYDPPSPALVIAGGGTVAIFDRKSDGTPQQFPLKRTPLSIILERNVDLKRADMITGIKDDELTTTIIAQDPDNPGYGSIELVFTANPVELRQWLITDESGNKTSVVLGEMQYDMRLGTALFSIPLEIRKNKDN